MPKYADAATAVLSLLAEPAFLYEHDRILWTNDAAAAVGFAPGDPLPLPLTAQPLPEGDDASHQQVLLFGRYWDLTVRTVENRHVFLLRPAPEEPVGDPMLLSAVRGILPALDELLAAGSQLLPEIEEMENEHLQSLAAGICQASFRLMRTAGTLSACDRLTREDAPIQREKCDLSAFFRDLAQRSADALKDCGRTLKYTGPKKSVFGSLDRQEVTRGVLHLLSNAGKYSDGDIVLRVSIAQNRLRITVSSQGTMPEDVFSTAFARFRQPATSRSQEGAGLGLYLAQTVARRHGGSLLLENRDGRTEVTMTLDISVPAQELDTPRRDFTGGYDPILVELSCLLPRETYDSRNVDL